MSHTTKHLCQPVAPGVVIPLHHLLPIARVISVLLVCQVQSGHPIGTITVLAQPALLDISACMYVCMYVAHNQTVQEGQVQSGYPIGTITVLTQPTLLDISACMYYVCMYVCIYVCMSHTTKRCRKARYSQVIQ